MSWKAVTIMSQRFEFVILALQESVNFSDLCRRFAISRKTGYKYLNRYLEEGFKGLFDRSKRPKHSPNITEEKAEHAILMLRDK